MYYIIAWQDIHRNKVVYCTVHEVVFQLHAMTIHILHPPPPPPPPANFKSLNFHLPSPMPQSAPPALGTEAEFLDETDKSRKSFHPCYSQSPLQLRSLPTPFPHSPFSNLSLLLSLPVCCRSSLLTGAGGRRAKTYDREKAWPMPSTNRSLLSTVRSENGSLALLSLTLSLAVEGVHIRLCSVRGLVGEHGWTQIRRQQKRCSFPFFCSYERREYVLPYREV